MYKVPTRTSQALIFFHLKTFSFTIQLITYIFRRIAQCSFSQNDIFHMCVCECILYHQHPNTRPRYTSLFQKIIIQIFYMRIDASLAFEHNIRAHFWILSRRATFFGRKNRIKFNSLSYHSHIHFEGITVCDFMFLLRASSLFLCLFAYFQRRDEMNKKSIT